MPLFPLAGLPMLAGLDLGVLGGITMPPVLVVEAAPEEAPAVAAKAVAPPENVPRPRPALPPRQTRN